MFCSHVFFKFKILFVFLGRDPDYYEDEHVKTEENTAHRMGADSGSFDGPSVSQPTVTLEASEVTQENQYSFPSSAADYSFENNQQLNVSFAQQQTCLLYTSDAADE